MVKPIMSSKPCFECPVPSGGGTSLSSSKYSSSNALWIPLLYSRYLSNVLSRCIGSSFSSVSQFRHTAFSVQFSGSGAGNVCAQSAFVSTFY